MLLGWSCRGSLLGPRCLSCLSHGATEIKVLVGRLDQASGVLRKLQGLSAAQPDKQATTCLVHGVEIHATGQAVLHVGHKMSDLRR